ncbi:RNA polymerase sigma-70 factor (ECF subfamily) [Kribbella amoyensis]|uniref:RNA polymerase sigma-70 factor (ECF subfamily) n=1 Tax=Kribbella amoyensis TaxID=996641 RepID=A0A561BUD1_9ACTN|nr:RNA polymerase sigma factor SigJ [Kribbella amoyensis]TWD82515.1 RNA polymerase sigma-70 factor (ECF subfamily) [Kribbella amoyensis]
MAIDPRVWQQQRGYLLAIAYRLLGSVTDAEDAVQEAFLRLERVDLDDIAELRAWLTTVVSRICLDELRSARARRETYVGPWLPEPLVGVEPPLDPVDQVAQQESVQMAMLLVLERLSPAERTAFVLHDVFGLEFAEIADIVGRSVVACRKLASRARAQVRAGAPRFDVSSDDRHRVIVAFQAAVEGGDVEGLVRLLDPEVVFRTDGGGVVAAARRTVAGPDRVAQLLFGLNDLYADASQRMAVVNGGPGLVMERDGIVIAVATITVTDDAVTAIDVIVNPAKLRHVHPG